MKIAFVSYEYPPETAFGGIATYVEQASLMLAERGHQVEVFAGGAAPDKSVVQQGIRVHRVQSTDQLKFYRQIFPVFLRRHREVVFDVIESPDYKHDGYWIAKKIADLAHVVRLHSGNHSSSRLFELTSKRNGFSELLFRLLILLRALGGAIKRGMPWRDWEGFCDYVTEIWNPGINDQRTAEYSDIVVSPCLELLKFEMKEWNLPASKAALLRHPYSPSASMLKIPCESKGKIIGYFGQMSERKGLRVLGEALAMIFDRKPDVRFLFVGRDLGMNDGISFPDYLLSKAGKFAGQLEFTGQVPLKDMPREYRRVDVCVFPSRWENFPNVCLEAMSAGRAVVASWNGGMSEILDSGQYGLLIPPNSPARLAEAILYLLERPEVCADFGQRSRDRILDHYSKEKIAPLQEELYQKAIKLRRESKNDS